MKPLDIKALQERLDKITEDDFQVTFTVEDMDNETEGHYNAMLDGLLKNYNYPGTKDIDDLEVFIQVRGMKNGMDESSTDIEEAYEYKPNPGKYTFYSTPEVNLSVQDFIAMVKKADADGYGSEPLYDAVYGRYGSQVEDYVVELQNDISSEMGLHPKDDYEKIEQEAFERILDEGREPKSE